jgi:hypothetical protein
MNFYPDFHLKNIDMNDMNEMNTGCPAHPVSSHYQNAYGA